MADFWTIDPTKIFQINGVVAPILWSAHGFATGNDQAVITAVTGQRIRFMGAWIKSPNVTQGTYAFKTASGGTFLTPTTYAPPYTDPLLQIPIIPSGYFETNTGEGLYVDITIANVNMTVFYVTYTPL